MITLENVSYSYPRNKAGILSGLTLDVADGEIFGLLGPSGGGQVYNPENNDGSFARFQWIGECFR